MSSIDRPIRDLAQTDDFVSRHIGPRNTELSEMLSAIGLSSMDALIEIGASPRATLGLVAAAQAMAFLDGRGYCVPQDFKTMAPAVLRHRIRASFEAEAEGLDVEAILERLLGHLPVP